MKKIYKSPIVFNKPFLIINTEKLLHFGFQDGNPVVWYENDLYCKSAIYVQILGTGEEIPEGWEHFQTQIEDWYVWHLYIRKF